MRNQRTIVLVFGILGVIFLASALSHLPYLKIYQEGHYVTYLPLFIDAASNIFISAAFCLVVWFMFIRDPGDKIPPLVMLGIGLLWLALVPLDIYAGLYMSAPWLALINYSPVNIICALFIVFGIAGLFTKPKV